MPIFSPYGDELLALQSNFANQRPPVTGGPVGVTSADMGDTNVKGAWKEVMGNTNGGGVLIDDAYALEITMNYWESAQFENVLMDIGYDPTGGTDYKILIPNLLFPRCDYVHLLGGGKFYLPIFVPKGSAIAVRGQISFTLGAIAKAVGVAIIAYGRPSKPELVSCGTYATSFGTSPTTTAGVTITAGTTAEGAWTLIASNTARPHFFWQPMFTAEDIALGGVRYHVDISAGSTPGQVMLMQDCMYITTTGNDAFGFINPCWSAVRRMPAGVNLWGRVQCSGTADSALSLGILGIG